MLYAYNYSATRWLEQCGPTTFDLRVRGILQKRDNLRATSNTMMYKTTDSQYFKTKIAWISESVIEIMIQYVITTITGSS